MHLVVQISTTMRLNPTQSCQFVGSIVQLGILYIYKYTYIYISMYVHTDYIMYAQLCWTDTIQVAIVGHPIHTPSHIAHANCWPWFFLHIFLGW
jgi:hypothetical protein